ncbi:MAG: hypothetical protein HZA19_01960 [Nitrospirae bacterium]|nr:hypothetical protein [Nitrospirota bacterium]
MPVKGYFQQIRQLLADSLVIVAQSITTEERPPSAGLIRGLLTFTDGSQLQFKEFVVYKETIQILKYSFHYMRSDQLVFRYDNAFDPATKHLPTYPDHKHLPDTILASEPPRLSDVLQEISFYVTRHEQKDTPHEDLK